MVRIGKIERRQLISDCVGAVHGRAGDTAFYAQAKIIQHSKQSKNPVLTGLSTIKV